MKKIHLFYIILHIFLCTALYTPLFAQAIGTSSDAVIPPSPEASSLGKFGAIPVNYSTGLPQVDIPLYTLKERDLTWNIHLNYLSSGFRPTEMPTYTGKNWTLRAGGVITREVRGFPDEQLSPLGGGLQGYLYKTGSYPGCSGGENCPNGFFQITQFLKDGAASITSGAPYNEKYYGYQTAPFDTSPDMFYFSFGDYSGSFFFDEYGVPALSSSKKMKIEYYIPALTSKAVYEPVINGKVPSYTLHGLNFGGPGAFVSTWWNIPSFRITAEDGTVFIFGNDYDPLKQSLTPEGLETMDFDVNTRIINAWYLKKIISTKGEIINFTYQKNPYNAANSSNINACSIPINSWGGIKQVSIHQSTDCSSGFLLFGAPTSRCMYVQYLSQISGTQWAVNFNSSTVAETNSSNYSYNRQKLDSFSIVDSLVGNTPLKTFYFTYSPSDNYRTLTQVQEKSGDGLTVANPYLFSYNSLPDASIDGTSAAVDRFGYYNAAPSPTANAGKPDLGNTLKGVLSKITYPTQGYTTFQYELNDFSYVQNQTATAYAAANISNISMSSINQMGGIRLNTMIDYPNNLGSSHPVVHTFTYLSANGGGILSSGSISDMMAYGGIGINVISNIDKNNIFVFRSEYNYWNPISNMAYVPVLYTRVLETINNENKIDRFFTSYSDGADYLDDWGSTWNGNTQYINVGPYGSRSYARGLPRKTDFYNKSGLLTTSTQNTYIIGSQSAFTVLYYEGGFGAPHCGSSSGNLGAYAKSFAFHSGWVQKIKEETTDYGSSPNPATALTTTTTYNYDNPAHLQVTKTRTTQSDGSVIETQLKYPLDYATASPKDNALQWMLDNNINSPVLEKVSIREKNGLRNVIGAEARTFQILAGASLVGRHTAGTVQLSNSNAMLLPYKTFTLKAANPVAETVFTRYTGTSNEISLPNYREINFFSQFNAYGNPLEIVNNQRDKTAYLWGYYRRYPIAKIAYGSLDSFASIMATFGTVGLASLETSPASAAISINTLRTNFPNWLIESYTYQPSFGLATRVDANQLTTTYTYDGLGRLASVKDNENNIVKTQAYNYANPAYQGNDRTSVLEWAQEDNSCVKNANNTYTFNVYVQGLSYIDPSTQRVNVAYFSTDGGTTWQTANTSLNGYNNGFTVTVNTSSQGFKAKAGDIPANVINGFLACP